MKSSQQGSMPSSNVHFAEQKRLNIAREGRRALEEVGPVPSERQWGTVREDYSADGNAWDYFSHDHSRSRAIGFILWRC